jgi:prevent-host-death family protein
VQIVTTTEAASNLSRLLESVEAGEEVLISRGHRPIAKLIPFSQSFSGSRPKVGQMISPPFKVPDAALAPLSVQQLESWGL